MTKIIKYIIIPILLVGLFSACGTITHTNKRTTYAPNKVELRINMSDLKYLGESEITLTYNQYLGYLSTLQTVNGATYDPTNVKKTKIQGIKIHQKYVNNALYKVVEEYPDADFYKLVYNKKEIDRLFLGKEVKQTIRIKAYSFK